MGIGKFFEESEGKLRCLRERTGESGDTEWPCYVSRVRGGQAAFGHGKAGGNHEMTRLESLAWLAWPAFNGKTGMSWFAGAWKLSTGKLGSGWLPGSSIFQADKPGKGAESTVRYG